MCFEDLSSSANLTKAHTLVHVLPELCESHSGPFRKNGGLTSEQLDRNAIAQARLNGLEKDLGLVDSQYNTCISILFVGYAASFHDI